MNKKVLVIDDSMVDQTNIRNVLTDVGCQVITASSGAEGIAKAKSDKPAVIFLDVIMPEMDGFEACRTLVNDPDTKDIPIVFVSSKGEKADKMWGQMQGAKGYVAKPFTSDQLIEQLKAVS